MCLDGARCTAELEAGHCSSWIRWLGSSHNPWLGQQLGQRRQGCTLGISQILAEGKGHWLVCVGSYLHYNIRNSLTSWGCRKERVTIAGREKRDSSIRGKVG